MGKRAVRIAATTVMSSPLGHLSMGVAWAFAVMPTAPTRSQLLTGAAAAAAADLDFVPGLLVGDPARFHHGASHSVVAMLIASAIVVGVKSRHGGLSPRDVALVTGAFLSHLVLDWLTHDPGTRRGLPLAWPFSSQRFAAPLWAVPAVSRAWPPTLDWFLHSAWLVLAELALVVPMVVGAWIGAGRPELPPGPWRSVKGGSSR